MRDEATIKAKIDSERQRTLENIALRTERPGMAYWLSFAAEDGFRGAVIVHAEDFITAVMECNLRDINPHGECQGMEIPAEYAAMIPEEWKYRVLSRSDCADFDKEMFKLRALAGAAAKEPE
jgi:hypothetical protein